MAKSPRYNKAAVDKQLTKNGVVKPKAKALTHKLLKGHQKTNEAGPFTKDIVNFSMFAGMYSDGAHAVFQGRDGKTHKVQATSDRPRKYYLDGQEISWDDLKRVAGRATIHPKQGFEPETYESVNESEMKNFKVTYQTKKGTTTVKVKARDKNEAEAKVRRRPNFQGNASARVDESTSYEKDMDNNKPVVVKGVRGANSKPFTKKFKNGAAYDRWLDSEAAGDYEVHQVMNESKKLTEGVLDDQDDDGFMAKRQLYDIAKYAVQLHKMIQDSDNLEPWIQAKITKAADYIDTVKHYLEYNDVRDAEAMVDFTGMDDLAPAVDAMGPQQPTEEVMEYGDEDEGSEVYPEDVLRWASNRGIISNTTYDAAIDGMDDKLWGAAQDVADSIGPVWEIGSSDVSIWLRDFVNTAKGYGALLDGDRAHVYESEIKASKIYTKMISGLRKK